MRPSINNFMMWEVFLRLQGESLFQRRHFNFPFLLWIVNKILKEMSSLVSRSYNSSWDFICNNNFRIRKTRERNKRLLAKDMNTKNMAVRKKFHELGWDFIYYLEFYFVLLMKSHLDIGSSFHKLSRDSSYEILQLSLESSLVIKF